MKDRLGQNRFWNLPGNSPVQNRYRRFMKTPGSDLKTAFTDSIEWFNKFKEEHETVYERLIGDL